MKYFLCILFSLLIFDLKAQKLEDIKKKADENQVERTYSSPSSTSSSGSSSPSGGYTGSTTVSYDDNSYYNDSYSSSGSGSGIFAIFQVFGLLVNGQVKALSKVDTVKWIRSLEGGLDAGVFQNNYWIMRPYFRGNWGIFSTSLRYYMSYEEVLGGIDSYNTLDWQIIHLNFVNDRNVRLSVGTGFMKEYYTNTSYHESTLGGVLFIKDWKADVTYRTARDYSTATNVRREISGGIHRKLVGKKHYAIYGSISGMKATYYEEVDLWTVGLGINAFFY